MLKAERNYIEIRINKTASAGTIMKYVYGILSTVFQSYYDDSAMIEAVYPILPLVCKKKNQTTTAQ